MNYGENFKKALYFLLFLGGILLVAEVTTIIVNELVTFRFDSEELNSWIFTLVMIGVFGVMIGTVTFVARKIDQFRSNKLLIKEKALELERKTNEEKAKTILKILAGKIIVRLSKEEQEAMIKHKELVTFNFLLYYSQNVLKPQDEFLKK
jgi:hypothetical protein